MTDAIKKRHGKFNVWWSEGNASSDPKSYSVWEWKEPNEEGGESKVGTAKGANKINKTVIQPHFASIAQELNHMYDNLQDENIP